MSRLFLVCVVLVLAALLPPARALEAGEAEAVEAIFADFDAAALNDSERRLLQTALAVAGDYRGPLDGAWGAASQAALRAYAGPSSAPRRRTPTPPRWSSASSRR